jgi:hypothetical protein
VALAIQRNGLNADIIIPCVVGLKIAYFAGYTMFMDNLQNGLSNILARMSSLEPFETYQYGPTLQIGCQIMGYNATQGQRVGRAPQVEGEMDLAAGVMKLINDLKSASLKLIHNEVSD